MYYIVSCIKNNFLYKIIKLQHFLSYFSSIPVEEAFKKLKEYTTFFVNRKPLQRAVSAHSSKFTSRVKLDGYKKRLGKPAALKYLPELVHNIKIRCAFYLILYFDKNKKYIVFLRLLL